MVINIKSYIFKNVRGINKKGLSFLDNILPLLYASKI